MFSCSRKIENEPYCFMEEFFNLFVQGMNRGITVGIAVYRYILVFYPFKCVGSFSTLNARILGIILGRIIQFIFLILIQAIKGYGLINSFIFVLDPRSNRRFNVCMGTDEQYQFNLDNFYEEQFLTAVTNFPLNSVPRCSTVYL